MTTGNFQIVAKFALAFLLTTTPAFSQTWTPIAPGATTHRDFNGAGAPKLERWQWYLPFPAANSGVPDNACPATLDPRLHWWRFSTFSESDPTEVWAGPVTGPFLRNPGGAETSRRYPSVRGLAFRAQFSGRLQDSSNITWNSLTQSVFYHRNYCFDGGPEFGFLRVLLHPGNATEESTILFYYSTDTNCEPARSLPLASEYARNRAAPRVRHGVCESATGVVEQRTVAVPIKIKPGATYDFSAYLASATHFRVEVRDVAGYCAFCQDVAVDPKIPFVMGPGHVSIVVSKAVAADANGRFFGKLTGDATLGVGGLKITANER